MTRRLREGRGIRMPMEDILGDRRRFPQDAGRATSTATATATPTATLPASVAGDYLVVFWRASSSLASGTSVPTGWSAAVTAASPDGSDDIVGCFTKQADGSEGTSLAFPNMGTARNFAMAAWRIANAGSPFATALTTQGAASSVSVPACNPAAGTKNYLYLVLVSTEDSRVIHAVCPPFGNLQAAAVSSGVNGVAVAGATLRSRSASLPGTYVWYFSMNGNSNNKTCLALAFPPS